MGLDALVPGFAKDIYVTLRNMSFREFAQQVVQLGLVVSSALIIWRILMLVTGSESPVVVVLSGSMEPAFQRGDILFLNMGKAPVRMGEIVVFNVDGRDIPIVHRVITVHEKGGENAGAIDVLTKGDNNYGDDRVLYKKGQRWLNQEHIMGRAVGYLPYVGMVTIIMNDYPYIKILLISVLGLFVIIGKEPQ
eukprot:TRINITY_DN25922_c0_g1_i2.p1 TRINITY_DN25922_c0_g1~~TRINITY_DN25922_c0_g1_i2.p1  ORF type:complete len:192 (+),score=24.52 TRINITY_DN25922_c0_g1_i2:168-743(+)